MILPKLFTKGIHDDDLNKDAKKLSLLLPVIFSLLILFILLILPTGYEDAVIYKGTDRCTAEVISVDDSNIIDTGLVRSGEQTCMIKLLGGRFKNQETEGFNLLNGSLESDKIFKPGDKVLVVISFEGDSILSINLIDHYRIGKEVILAVIFGILLIVVAGATGFRALISFIITILMIWKVLVPFYLNGYNPIYLGLLITILLTIIIITLVFGFGRMAFAAISGASLGVLVTCLLGVLFTGNFKIHGAIMPNSESLLYSGFQHLDLTKIFMASIFIGSSGAVMDLAVDITSAINEVISKKPGMKWREAFLSGMNVGKAAMGTMTTTLLLAYSGGYLALLMVFMAQGTPVYNILNYKYVSSEILDTFVGSIGLVLVAPFTAFTCSIMLTQNPKTTFNHWDIEQIIIAKEIKDSEVFMNVEEIVEME
ncbi:MAG: multitransrane protein-like, partial [Anaerocolumna sp.]|nr:multitransrane protein-like [Anaerocolumna sp.]